jgi:predicted acylesterase/phospholipase RssA
MLSAILETEDTGFNGITMDLYKQLLFSMDDSQVFANDPIAIARILTHNIPNGYVLDNSPFEKLLQSWLKTMNYTTVADLYIPTAISIVDQQSGHTTRIWSDDPRWNWLDLHEVLMASISLPIAFATRQISGLPGDWMDGKHSAKRML